MSGIRPIGQGGVKNQQKYVDYYLKEYLKKTHQDKINLYTNFT
jgi:hypothetical protein